jgi:DNA-binding transcriptional LysR family regulator
MNDLHAIDLNLLVVLDALLAERHVTRAATRVGLTQSAASHALARLRELLDDPLLVRGPRGALVRTPRADALAPALHRALEQVREALRGEPSFDPATARRTFRIAASDYAELIVLPPLLERIARLAPAVDVWAVPLRDDPAPDLAAGDVDLSIGVWRARSWPSGFYQRRLFDDRFRVVLRAGHPAAQQRLTLARYVALPHLLIAPRGTAGGYVDDALAEIGQSRRVAAAVPHFLVAPHVIAATDLVVTLAARVAAVVTEPFGLLSLPPPLELPTFTTAMLWHERAHHDAGQHWLRARILDVSPRAAAPSAAPSR